MNTIGAPISRADGRLKVTGRAAYTADIPLADAAHAAFRLERVKVVAHRDGGNAELAA